MTYHVRYIMQSSLYGNVKPKLTTSPWSLIFFQLHGFVFFNEISLTVYGLSYLMDLPCVDFMTGCRINVLLLAPRFEFAYASFTLAPLFKSQPIRISF